jgi:hypothetical protein
MKRFESGAALAEEMGLKPEVLKKTFDEYNAGVRANKDPFGKKVQYILCFTFRPNPLCYSFSPKGSGPCPTTSMSQ